jgi:serine/threonine-protein kinase
MLYEVSLTPQTSDIGTLSIEGEKQRKGLLEEKWDEADPQVSPDGRWIAYSSTASGRSEIYVRPFPDVEEGMWQVSTSGGHSPLWSPDGNELFYRNGDATMVVQVETDPTFNNGDPEILFQGRYITSRVNALLSMTSWDIHPDGDRFLMIKPSAETEGEPLHTITGFEPREIIVVTNWIEELKERVPVD